MKKPHFSNLISYSIRPLVFGMLFIPTIISAAHLSDACPSGEATEVARETSLPTSRLNVARMGTDATGMELSQTIADDPFELIMQRVLEQSYKRLVNQKESSEQVMAKFDAATGAFSDVDYASIARTHWPPLVHLQRISGWVEAYTNPQNSNYGRDEFYEKIEKGLRFWHERNPWCHNWWYNQIAEPQCMGLLLIRMRTAKRQLPKELEQQLLERIKSDGGDPAKWTGANRTDIALHWIYRACLSRDEADLKKAIDNAYSPLCYTTKEGFQHDNSYFQHGVQLYIGGYGDEIIKGITSIGMLTRGTSYAIPKEKLEILTRFVRGTYYPVIRGQYLLFDVLGRGMSRPHNTLRAGSAYLDRLMVLDPEHKEEYETIKARVTGKQGADYGVKPAHTHYFRADYTLHSRPHYSFDVRTVSTRTMRCEYGNEENLKTYFVSDGCTNIALQGDEYADIFPVWNWTCIPGTTAPQMKEIPMAKGGWQTRGTSTFAGGVSDSLYGASTYAYYDSYKEVNTGAHKGWFFFDDEVVCLGSDITSTATDQVLTTVNQCLTHGEEVLVEQHGKPTSLNAESSLNGPASWVLHRGVGYLFPKGGELTVTRRTQQGSWYDINHSHANDILTREVLTLNLSHGVRPSQGDYAYIVLPGVKDIKSLRRYSKSNPIEIVSNEPDRQVVRHKKLKIWQCIFYQPGSFDHPALRVEVDAPCILMLKEEPSGKVTVHLADPQQKQQEIHLSVSRKGMEKRTICFDFRNTGIYAGKSIRKML